MWFYSFYFFDTDRVRPLCSDETTHRPTSKLRLTKTNREGIWLKRKTDIIVTSTILTQSLGGLGLA